MVDMIVKAVSLFLALLLVLTIPTIVNYNIENSNLKKQVASLQEEISQLQKEIGTLKPSSLMTANIVTALGFTEVPPNPKSNSAIDRNFSHLWITGSLFNSGGGRAIGVGLNILAYDESNKVLMNVTVPIVSGGYSVTYAIPPHNNLNPAPIMHTNIFSQQKMTVILGIYHQGIFSDSTRYEAIPIYKSL
jgi:hypothetical protein